jgi:hypothetical protein
MAERHSSPSFGMPHPSNITKATFLFIFLIFYALN